jgi:hypothetical protein
MKAIVFALLVASSNYCFAAADTNVIAVSDWSQSVDGLRGRVLVLYEGRETVAYLELQNVSDAKNSCKDIYFDPASEFTFELRDALDKSPRQVGGRGSGGFPMSFWVSLPPDSTIRLRASWYGYGYPRGRGLMIPLYHHLTIPEGDTNDYFLTGTFTANAPTNHVSLPDHILWQRTLTLPKTRVFNEKP